MIALAVHLLVVAAQAPAPDPGLRVLGAADFQTRSEIVALAFHPEGRRLAAGTHYDGIVVWDLETRKETARIPVSGAVTDLRYWGDGGTHLLFMTMEQMKRTSALVLWDLAGNKAVLQLPVENYYNRLAVSPDGRTVATGAKSADVLAWELPSGKVLPGLEEVARVQKDVQYRVDALAFTADGARVACVDRWSGASNNAKYDNRARISVWEWQSGRRLHEWISKDDTFRWRGGLEWLPDGEHLVMHGTKGTFIVKAADGTVVRRFDGTGLLDAERSRLLSHQGSAFATIDRSTGEVLDTFPIPAFKNLGQAILSPDGRWFAAANMGQTPAIVDLKARRSVAPDGDGHLRQPYGVEYTPDGRLLVFDGALTRVYDDSTGEVLRRFASGFYVVRADPRMSPDGRLLLAAGGSGGRAELWDTVRGELLGKLNPGEAKGGGIQAVYMSRDAAWAATLREYTGTLQFHDLRTGATLGRLVGPKDSFFGRMMHVNSVHWSPSGDRVYVGCANGPWLNGARVKEPGQEGLLSFTGCFDPRSGKRLFAFETPDEQPIEDAETVDVHEASDLVYVAGRTFHGLWKASTGAFVREVEKPGPLARFSPDGRRLVSADGRVDVKTGADLRRFDFGKRRVPSPSGTLVAAFDDGPTVAIHDAGTGREIARRDVTPAGPAGKIHALFWHPAETQVALVVEKQAAVIQVDLFPATAPARDAGPGLEALEDKDPARRTAAAGALAALGPSVDDRLRDALARERGKPDSILARMAVDVLERRARRGDEEAAAMLRERADPDAPGGVPVWAYEAGLRLDAEARARTWRGKHRNAEPMMREWK
ncbi:MAG TPA: WD40 repeat domain-containing protein [Planctomycetota bacterium]|nr:WD40 repeat domain-containing protein [Planctomycetota bacterium]